MLVEQSQGARTPPLVGSRRGVLASGFHLVTLGYLLSYLDLRLSWSLDVCGSLMTPTHRDSGNLAEPVEKGNQVSLGSEERALSPPLVQATIAWRG